MLSRLNIRPSSGSSTGEKRTSRNGRSEYPVTHLPDRPKQIVHPRDAPSENSCGEYITAWKQGAPEKSHTYAGDTSSFNPPMRNSDSKLFPRGPPPSSYENRHYQVYSQRRPASSISSGIASDSIRPESSWSQGSSWLDGELPNRDGVEKVDVLRLYQLESARRGFCLLCKSRSILPRTLFCNKCRVDFANTGAPGSRGGPTRQPQGQEYQQRANPSSYPEPGRPARIPASAPTAKHGNGDGGICDDDGADLSPIDVTFHLNHSNTAHRQKTIANTNMNNPRRPQESEELSPQIPRAAMMHISPALALRDELVRTGKAPEVGPIPAINLARALNKKREAKGTFRTGDARTPNPLAATKLTKEKEKASTPRESSRKLPMSRFNPSQPAGESRRANNSGSERLRNGQEAETDENWELDIISAYLDPPNAPQYPEWI